MFMSTNQSLSCFLFPTSDKFHQWWMVLPYSGFGIILGRYLQSNSYQIFSPKSIVSSSLKLLQLPIHTDSPIDVVYRLAQFVKLPLLLLFSSF